MCQIRRQQVIQKRLVPMGGNLGVAYTQPIVQQQQQVHVVNPMQPVQAPTHTVVHQTHQVQQVQQAQQRRDERLTKLAEAASTTRVLDLSKQNLRQIPEKFLRLADLHNDDRNGGRNGSGGRSGSGGRASMPIGSSIQGASIHGNADTQGPQWWEVENTLKIDISDNQIGEIIPTNTTWAETTFCDLQSIVADRNKLRWVPGQGKLELNNGKSAEHLQGDDHLPTLKSVHCRNNMIELITISPTLVELRVGGNGARDLVVQGGFCGVSSGNPYGNPCGNPCGNPYGNPYEQSPYEEAPFSLATLLAPDNKLTARVGNDLVQLKNSLLKLDLSGNMLGEPHHRNSGFGGFGMGKGFSNPNAPNPNGPASDPHATLLPWLNSLSNLSELSLDRNRLKGILKLTNLPNLIHFSAQDNLISWVKFGGEVGKGGSEEGGYGSGGYGSGCNSNGRYSGNNSHSSTSEMRFLDTVNLAYNRIGENYTTPGPTSIQSQLTQNHTQNPNQLGAEKVEKVLSLKNTPSLSSLIISNNKMKMFPKDLPDSLQTLDLGNNDIRDVPAMVGKRSWDMR